MLKPVLAALLALAVGAAHASEVPQPGAPAAVAVTPVAAPVAMPGMAGMAKGRPQLGSGVAFAPDGSLWLVGVNAQGQLFVQTTAPGDWQHWGAARVLDTQDDTVAADGESRPKLAFGPQGLVVISYAKALGKPFTAFVRMLRSTDGGKTFSAPFTVHADRQEITHRFDSIAFDAQGALHTVWIDKRDLERALERAPKAGKQSAYRGAAIYRNVSRDGGLTFGPDLRVADHSCECCRIALAQGNDGRAYALWRHVFEPNVRDHAFAALAATGDGAATDAVPARATFDDWRVNACPHHGPALSASAAGGFHAVWFGIRRQGGADVPGVRYGRLHADGSPVVDSVRVLPDERAEHADVLAAGDRVAVVWRSADGARSSIKAWLSSDGGRTFREQLLGEVNGPNDFPRLAQYGGQMVVVWRNPQEARTYALTF